MTTETTTAAPKAPARKTTKPKAATPKAAPAKAARASKIASLMDKFLSIVADEVFEVEATAKKLNVSGKMVRNCIDQLRRKGGKAAVANVGKGSFKVAAQ